MKHQSIQLYKNREDVVLETYIWDDSIELLKGRKRPAILICPGGGYLMCSHREAEPIALRFAAMGYHTFVLKYSVYDEGGKAPINYNEPLPMKESTQYPTQIREIAMSIQLIHEHAEDWLVDMNKLCLMGFSAGAHNCALYATQYHQPVIKDFIELDESILKPQAVILGYTMSDFIMMKKEAETSESAKQLLRYSLEVCFGTQEISDDLLKEFSPSYNVSEKTPPMFLWATADDTIVSIAHSLNLSSALSTYNIPFELHIFETGAHGLSLSDQASAHSNFLINDSASKWVVLAEEWLKKRIALTFEE